jgi:hypothetical protein
VVKSLGPDDWKRVMRRLAAELPPDRQRRVILIGGVAMALGYGSRRTTNDADTVMGDADVAEILEAADRIAPDFQLAAGWLNQKAFEAGLITPPEAERIVLETPALALEVPSAEHMLAMKVARFAGNTDTEDAIILLKAVRSRYSDVEELWTAVGGLVPVARQDTARYNLFKIWEDPDESP